MHKLLQRQLIRCFGKDFDIEISDENTKKLLLNVSNAYHEYEFEKNFIEHTLEISAEELYETNSRLQKMNADLENMVEKELTKNREKDFLLLQQSRHAQMGEMIAMIAHQWRQPLATISAIVGNLQIQQALEEYDAIEHALQLEKIETCTQHLSNTIQGFSEFFKEEKQKSNTSLEDTINESLEIVEDALKRKGIEIEKEYKCNIEIFSYSNELKQVVLSLLKNSEEALEENQIENAKIKIETYKDDKYCYFKIFDNAKGISEEIKEKIFDPYFTTKCELNGTGLGLYMAQKVIQEHCKGKISVENLNDGACFTIQLNKS